MESDFAPTQIIILGGGGDLSQRKLLPALFHLFCNGHLPAQFQIIGLARTKRTDADYRELVRSSLLSTGHQHQADQITSFIQRVCYVAGSFTDESSYTDINTAIEAYQESIGCRTNKLFYLAVPPDSYETIFDKLKTSNLVVHNAAKPNWTRILVEKPFGKDLITAQALETSLSQKFHEEQIFRIDHYLAKDAVQNILSFRFANALTKNLWNKDHIDRITISLKETVDVDHRASFYEGVGALRDVGQNHLLQLLALVTMPEPADFSPANIRLARASMLENLQPITKVALGHNVYRAQYEGFRDLDCVPDTSMTETYFELTTQIDHPDWKNVPITLIGGKALDEAAVTVEIHFKDVTSGLFETESCHTTNNKITLTISPEQTIDITLNAKMPGLGYQLESRTLSFTTTDKSEIKNSYEKVLLDCISGDHTLFTSTDEVLAAWRFITPILESWNDLPLATYQKGTDPTNV